ncbi:MAG: hypothetical protein U0794_17075 [Isosphaeraceae bacterium]
MLNRLAETPAERAAVCRLELSSLPPAESRALVLLCLGIFNHNELSATD